MGVYFGQSGEIALKRDALQSALSTKLDPADVNTSRRRFSVDHSSGSLLTGDKVDISAPKGTPLKLVSGHTNSAGEYYEDGSWFINVDPVGGLRLYNTFALAIEGLQSTALALVVPDAATDIVIKTRNENFRHVANVRDFEMTTSREQVDLTNLGDEFRNQYEAGIISGQGSMSCIWEHSYETGNRKTDYGTDSEFPFYLAQLIVRTQQGSDFDGLFYIYRDTNNARNNVYYEANCVITNVAVTVSVAEVIETRVEFVTNGAVKLKTGDTPGYLLQENSDKILQENLSPILLEQV